MSMNSQQPSRNESSVFTTKTQHQKEKNLLRYILVCKDKGGGGALAKPPTSLSPQSPPPTQKKAVSMQCTVQGCLHTLANILIPFQSSNKGAFSSSVT